MISEQEFTGHWNQLKGKIQERWGQISDDELREVEGHLNQLVGLIQQKTGEGREAIEHLLRSWDEDCGGKLGEAAAAARQYVDRGSEAFREASEQVTERAREGYSEAQRLVRQRPAESVAVAFGTGLIAGVIVGLISRSR
jgi:uncharacterized protein YjbJ (UPF0337 family)